MAGESMGLARQVNAVIFDLDGTLAHTLPGIQQSAQWAVDRAMPGVHLPDLRRWIGPPIGSVLLLALGAIGKAPSDVDALVADFRRNYDTTGWKQSVLFPHVLELLQLLGGSQARLSCFLVTNKPAHATALICEHLGLAPFMRDIVSPDSHGESFPSKTDAVAWLVNRYQLKSATTALIGDSADDQTAAAKNGVRFIGAVYGYGHVRDDPAVESIQSMAELPQILGLSVRANG